MGDVTAQPDKVGGLRRDPYEPGMGTRLD